MNAQGSGGERRLHKRRTLRTIAHVVLPDQQLVEVRTFDISAGGLGIIAALNPQAGATFSIRMKLVAGSTSSTLIEAPVMVTHSIFGAAEQGFKIGLRFLKLDPEARAVIMQYLDG